MKRIAFAAALLCAAITTAHAAPDDVGARRPAGADITAVPRIAGSGDCVLSKEAALDLGQSADGFPTARLGVGGKDYMFSLSTASIASLIAQRTAEDLKLHLEPYHVMDVGGYRLSTATAIPELTMGGLTRENQVFYVAPDALAAPGTVGRIGLDRLEDYDVELDLAHDKLNLFSRAHCGGKGVYWVDEVVAIPLTVQDAFGQFTVPMTLDGVTVNVLIDSDARSSWMTYVVAHRLFGIERKSLQPVTENGVVVPDVYRYPFRSLAAGGLSITNPDIFVADDDSGHHICDGVRHSRYRCFGGGDMHLGLKQLRQLRLFIAFSEKTLYITAANAH